MAMTHPLKVWPEFFQATIQTRKTWELRKNDRGFQVGDLLQLQEYDPDTEAYTGRETFSEVVYVLENFEGLQPGYAILGTEVLFPEPLQFTQDELKAILTTATTFAMQGPLSPLHHAFGKLILYYYPVLAHQLQEDPEELLRATVDRLHSEAVRRGLINIPFDRQFAATMAAYWTENSDQ